MPTGGGGGKCINLFRGEGRVIGGWGVGDSPDFRSSEVGISATALFKTVEI